MLALPLWMDQHLLLCEGCLVLKTHNALAGHQHANQVYAAQICSRPCTASCAKMPRDVIIILTFAFYDQGVEQADALLHG